MSGRSNQRSGFKGRGALDNPANRYHAFKREAIDDVGDDGPGPETELIVDHSRSALAWNESPDLPFDRSVNPYRGCEHGCIYCYARPSHAWLGYSPGLDFETRIVYKPDVARLLAAEIDRPGYRCGVIALGTNTDPYQPADRQLRLTRAVLALLHERRHPVSVTTKSSLVERDLDILADMAAGGLAQVLVSLPTIDDDLSRCMEPRAAAPGRRLETIARLARAGVPTGVLVAPVIPGLSDDQLESILERAAAAGARSAAFILLRLPGEVKDLFRAWLAAHYPLRADKVLSLVASVRGGRLNDPRFGSRMRGQGPVADLIRRRFALARRRTGLDRPPPVLDTSAFRPGRAQLSLF
jgi:DNA repair photolyase